jgi:hypothetical protein
VCISAGAAALLAAGTAASVGGSIMRQNAYEDRMDQYNREASERNRRVSEQYADRQQKIYNARDAQERLFQQLTDTQDAEQERQRAFADERRQQLNEALNAYTDVGRRRDEVAEGAAKRRSVADKAGDFGVTAGYETSGSAAPEVVRDRVSDRAESGAAEGRERADAMFQMGGFDDLNLGDRNLFRMLETDLNTTAQDARRSRRDYNASLAPIRSRNQALNRSQRFYGSQGYGIPEPVFQQPNTGFADALSGLGNLGTTIGAQNLFTGAGGGQPAQTLGEAQMMTRGYRGGMGL